jgi:hypothetical protein
MTHVANLSGRGTLRSAEGDECPVTYSIDVWQHGGLKSGDGQIGGDLNFTTLHAMFNSKDHLTLEMDHGSEVKLSITGLNSASSIALIETSGPVPGV